ncbi:flavin reductase family protein [Streptomyces parvus]|uniref:flavin reductase family protein n=1 Tax=Streptomyces TaxID=1883 RepID=UPI00067C14B5|nr:MULTISPECIES: flavin reductase family protein [unclassified Streptomyces]MYX04937.1 flavin reductase [Streptomyces sp. SID8378]SNB89526.1 NADH-FMN oxidoreductase RutF, flavin reductase (DIM6/NTAB) family [Streptomyces sp. PgraA7]
MTDHAALAATEATPDTFRTMMSGFPSGVCVVTTHGYDGAPRGMTCSAVCSVSLEPPTLLVCLRDGSPTLESIMKTGSFAVNLLHGRAQQVAELFASGDPERFDRTPWESAPGSGGPHLVRDAHTVADCDVVLTQSMGSHVTVFGAARRITRRHAHPPLLYGLRQFRSWPAA